MKVLAFKQNEGHAELIDVIDVYKHKWLTVWFSTYSTEYIIK